MAPLSTITAGFAVALTLGCKAVPRPSLGTDARDPVVLTLGEQTVRRSEFDRHVAAIQSRGGVSDLTPEVRQALFDRFLEERVLVLEARARGMGKAGEPEDKETDAVRRLLTDAVLSRVEVSDGEVDGYCQAHVHDYDRPERVRVRQILVPTVNEARDVVRRLKKDPKSFAVLAQTRSRGPEASTGGAMGEFAKGELPAELEKAAFSLDAGQTSDVVQSPLGFHVLRVDERVPAREAALPDCRAAARAELLRRKSDQSVKEFVRDLMARAKVNHEALSSPRPS